eukprot:gnl/TRDRNA2_/TRDRNA2_172582_c0_seq2.p1 gnl/TRDRNA2_/TRDRNA2_172582_c0~~gnl/TRDRNA2_/TRDRNA2_172582_c0_seq2.p1  ORF type:complete len:177 (-),score=26.60 gnl/TRDRNA2_/TRDRNA2_172582_c0_seq2:63-593(-)
MNLLRPHEKCTCGNLRTVATTSPLDLSDALALCKQGARANALTLDDCPGFDKELDLSGTHEYFVQLERYFEAHLHCAGLCRHLVSPVFTARSISSTHKTLPPCWRRKSIAAARAGRALTAWLGLLNTPSLLAAALAIVVPLSALPGGTATVGAGGYRTVPMMAAEIALSPSWPDVE